MGNRESVSKEASAKMRDFRVIADAIEVPFAVKLMLLTDEEPCPDLLSGARSKGQRS